jgi:DNA-binding MarR family transcriptional regulator
MVAASSDRAPSSDAGALTEVVTRLRRVLRTSIRTEYPWESLPMAQVELLLALRERQPARIGELATRLKLAPNTISGLVQQLVEAGLVSRGPAPADRRVAAVTLTPAGLAKLDEWELAHHRRLSAALADLGAADRAAVRAALPALARLVERLGEPG